MKIQFKKILIWGLVVYFSVGFIVAGDYLVGEYKTFECPMANGDILTMSSENGIFNDKLNGCTRRMYSVRTLMSAGGMFFLWLPIVYLRVANSL